MEYLPGAHKKFLENVEKINQFTSEIISEHQKTLDPACPRDFIDAFLNKMEQVM